MDLAMKNRVIRVMKWFKMNLVLFLILFLSVNQVFNYNSLDWKNSEYLNYDQKLHLKSSFTFTFNESFQTLTFKNESITNTSGWGEDFLFIPHQKIINISNYNYNFNRINSIIPDGNLLYIADNTFGLKVLNISNPEMPILISRFGDTYNSTFDATIRGKYAYVADGEDGMEIIDISNPVSPQKINFWSNGYNVTNVLISDNLAFLSVQGLGIEIINISDPLSLIRVANWTNYENPCNVIVRGSYLFVASDNYMLEILDFSDLNNIIKVGELPITNTPYKIIIKGDYLYLANGDEGLKVINLKDISNPNLVGTLNQDSSITDILIEENYALLINNTFRLNIIDLLDITKQVIPNGLLFNEKITSIKIYGEYIYLGCESKGLQILKFSEFINPKNIYDFTPNINARNIVIDNDNDRLYLCAIDDGVYDGGLFIFNISDPFHPQYLGNFSKPGYDFYDVEIIGDICYAAAYDYGLIALNASNPANLKVLDSIGGYILNFSQSIEIFDKFAFVANGLIGLNIYNISDPLNLKYITNYPGDLSNGVYSCVKIRDNCAYIAKGYEGIEVLDINDINNIKSIVNYTDSYNNSLSLEFWGNYLLVADRFDGLEIFDITDVKNLQKIGQYADIYNRTVSVNVIDNLAVISDRTDGIEIINISDPTNPLELASYSDDNNNTWGCAMTSRFLYIADARDGLQVVQYKEHLFNQYKQSAIAQSLEIDKTIATITNATIVINGEVPTDTSIQIFLSNDNGNNWESVTNNSLHSFSSIGSQLLWRIVFSTINDLLTPKIFALSISYSAINTPPIILNPNQLQSLAIWTQQEDFGFFEIDLSSYKDDNEFSAEYLYWSIENLDVSLVSVVQDSLNQDIFRFYSIDNVYGSDDFNLTLMDEAGASVSLNISLEVYSVNDAPFFIENNINIQVLSNQMISIEYEANDVDNLISELNYSIFYGSGNDWNLIIENYKELAYEWDISTIPQGVYYIKILVSDGIDNSTWISTRYYTIGRDSSLIPLIVIFTVFGGGIGLSITIAIYSRIRKRKKKFLPVKE